MEYAIDLDIKELLIQSRRITDQREAQQSRSSFVAPGVEQHTASKQLLPGGDSIHNFLEQICPCERRQEHVLNRECANSECPDCGFENRFDWESILPGVDETDELIVTWELMKTVTDDNGKKEEKLVSFTGSREDFFEGTLKPKVEVYLQHVRHHKWQAHQYKLGLETFPFSWVYFSTGESQASY